MTWKTFFLSCLLLLLAGVIVYKLYLITSPYQNCLKDVKFKESILHAYCLRETNW